MPDWPSITPEFMASYDHATPSGTRHPQCAVNRLAFLGIDCRMEAPSPLDLDRLTDRGYTHIWETSDDGWLIGGGEAGKLPRPDTAHAEIWRLGPDNREQGGLPLEEVHARMADIAFAPLVMKPRRVNLTPTSELELLFHYEPESAIGRLFGLCAHVFACPCGDYGNPFHITLARGVKFRDDAARTAYFAAMEQVVAEWQAEFPDGVLFNDGGLDLFAHREKILHHYEPTLDEGVQWAG